jgi:hypothetical protein
MDSLAPAELMSLINSELRNLTTEHGEKLAKRARALLEKSLGSGVVLRRYPHTNFILRSAGWISG